MYGIGLVNPKRHHRRPQSGARSPSRSPSKQPKGFAELDPGTMGFDLPSWMDEPSNLDSPGETSQLAGNDDVSAEATHARTIVEGMKVVCICKGIRQRVFWRALDAGMCTKEAINRETGSGSGSCGGRRCGPRILDMLRHLSE